MRLYPSTSFEVKWSAEDEYVRSIMDEMKAATQAVILAKRRQRVHDFLDAFSVVDTLRDDAEAYAPYVSAFAGARQELVLANQLYHKNRIRDAIIHVGRALLYIKHGLRMAGLYGRTREKPKKLREEATQALEEVLKSDLEEVAERTKKELPEETEEQEEQNNEEESDEEW